ncbi:MAG: DUF4416 family protein [Deltaproteobacteria bacterium]|nr:DUF4416 family protein [Deltaproteobacteria bacterium]
MSSLADPGPAKICMSILSSGMDRIWTKLQEILAARFGEMDHVSDPLPFDQTTYYDRELGQPILRRLVSFRPLVRMDSLVEVKHWTNALEMAWSQDGKRAVNLDPGLLTLERLVLATGKNFSHRVYLGKGVWADLTLVYGRGGWIVQPWTFPDYAGAVIQNELTAIRAVFAVQVKAWVRRKG